MNASTRTLSIDGPVGPIDAALDVPATAAAGVAVVAHPHPLFGGTRDNKVVQTLARALVSLGYRVWRPNFRGVGDSAGSHDEGAGETDDLVAVVKQALADPALAHLSSPIPLVLAGFSFGSFVQSRVAMRLHDDGVRVARMILVGTAVERFSVEPVPDNTLLIHGELDDVVPLASVLKWARQGDAPVVVIAGADHFFHRKLTVIKRIVLQAWGQSDPAGEISAQPGAAA
jgi:uncharacterized protein